MFGQFAVQVAFGQCAHADQHLANRFAAGFLQRKRLVERRLRNDAFADQTLSKLFVRRTDHAFNRWHLEPEFRVVMRDAPTHLIAQRLIRLHKIPGQVLDGFDRHRVQRIDERDAKRVTLECERQRPEFLGAFTLDQCGHFRVRFELRQIDQRIGEFIFDGAGDAAFTDHARIDQDVGQPSTNFGVALECLLQVRIGHIAKLQQDRAEATVTNGKDRHQRPPGVGECMDGLKMRVVTMPSMYSRNDPESGQQPHSNIPFLGLSMK